MSQFFHVVLFTTLDHETAKVLMNLLDVPDRVFQTVHSGDTEDVLPCHFYDIDPEKVLRIGDLRDFEWELDTEFGIDADVLSNDALTSRLLEHVRAFMAKHMHYPHVGLLFEELTGTKAGESAADIVVLSN